MSTDQPSKSASPAFLLDPILPARSVNLLGGRSGSGKTTLLLQLLEDWSAGREVFGATSRPAPWCYVACAKPPDDIISTAEAIGVEFSLPKLPIISLTRSRLAPGEEVTPEYALKLARAEVLDLRLLILDGIGRLCSAGGKRVTEYNVVAEFMANLIAMARRENVAIIGVGPIAKSSTGGSSRDLFLGSVAWAEYARTMITIESTDPKDSKCLGRIVTIHSPNSPTQDFNYEFDSRGRLQLMSDDSLPRMLLNAKLEALPPGQDFSSETAIEWAKEVGASRALVFLWLKQLVSDGKVDKIARGVYKVKHTI